MRFRLIRSRAAHAMAACIVTWVTGSVGTAETVYESATLGTTGRGGGFVVGSAQFLGVRFELDQAVTATAIGGHFGEVGTGEGQFFGAVVRLSGPSDFPDSADLQSADVLGTALLDAPLSSSAEVSATLNPLALAPGYYALVFGSGHFGATASAVAPGSDPNVASPSYFFRNGSGVYVNGGFSNVRMFLTGTAAEVAPVPLPAAAWAGMALFGVIGAKRLRRTTKGA